MEPVGAVITQYRKEHGLSTRAFAKQCQLSHSYIRNLEQGLDPSSGKKNVPTTETIEALAKGMGLSVAGLLERTMDVVSVEELSAEHKATVIKMINFFRQDS